MTVSSNAGDEVQGERIICIYNRRSDEVLLLLAGGHWALTTVIKGSPARAIVDKLWHLKQ